MGCVGDVVIVFMYGVVVGIVVVVDVVIGFGIVFVGKVLVIVEDDF